MWSITGSLLKDFRLRRYTGGYFQTNAYLIEKGEACILIDAPEGVEKWLHELQAKPSALLLTHLHYDHVLGAAATQESFDCPIWAHSPPDGDLLLTDFLRDVVGWPTQVASFSVDELLGPRLHSLPGKSAEVRVGNVSLEVRHVPGHSPDSVVFRLSGSEESGDWLFGGDTLFRLGVGRTDFPHGDSNLLLNSITQQVFTLPEATRVFPGHGGETTVGYEKIHNRFLRDQPPTTC